MKDVERGFDRRLRVNGDCSQDGGRWGRGTG